MIADISKAMFGEVEADALYLGSTLIYKRYAFEEEFLSFTPQSMDDRLAQPTENDWGVWNNDDDAVNKYVPSESVVENGILKVPVKAEIVNGEATGKYLTGFVYSKKMFGKGRIDIRAKMLGANDKKSTIWCNTTTMTDSVTGLNYLYELDVVEYQPNDGQGANNTSRGMWTWRNNQISGQALPTIFELDGVKHSYCAGNWYWNGNDLGWAQHSAYRVIYDGNKLIGHTDSKAYFLKDAATKNTAINSSNLTWIDEDGNEGTGLNSNSQFDKASTSDAVGKGSIKTQFLNGDTVISDWHIWSVIIDDTYIAYLCDDVEYWRITNSDLHTLTIADDIATDVTFSTKHIPGNTHSGDDNMLVDYVRFTPKSASNS